MWLWVANRAGFTTPGLEGAECDRAGQGGAGRLRGGRAVKATGGCFYGNGSCGGFLSIL